MPENIIVASAVIPYEEGFVYVMTESDGKWGLAGGKIDPKEDLRIGLIREVVQETNLEILIRNMLPPVHFESGSGNTILNLPFVGEVIQGTPSVIRPKEIREVSVLNIGEIRSLYRGGKIRSGYANLGPVEDYLLGNLLAPDTVRCFLQR
ncbi:MAG: NUDIX hydrolase [archaeon]